MIWVESNDWTIDQSFVEFGEFFLDDRDGIGKSVEWDLREKMVFSLELHASHEDKPEEVGLFIVSAGDDLVVNEGMFDLFGIGVFSFVISNKDKGGVESSQKVSD